MEFDNNRFTKFNRKTNDLEISGSFLNDDVIVYKLIGILDGYNASDFANLIRGSILFYSVSNVVLDLEKLTYMNAAGAAALIDIVRTSKNSKINLYLLNIEELPKELLKLLGLNSSFSYINDLDEIDKIEASIFPKEMKCINCGAYLNVSKVGKFVCPKCNQTLVAKENGSIELETEL